MHLLHVIGARPNFVKFAPLYHRIKERSNVTQTVVHTGQHYALALSDVFFEELGLPAPDINLGVGSDTHARQTASVMIGLEPVISERKPDVVVVYGDVNSTVAAALVCAKLRVKLAHVEAGLRSFDRSMPEEINRIITDQLCDLLFTPSLDANQNLAREGVDAGKVHLVGNLMIDTLVRMLPAAQATVRDREREPYILVTLHRPGNVDENEWLQSMLHSLGELSARVRILFPIHPRTRKRMLESGIVLPSNGNLHFLEPLSYLEFLGLQSRAAAVITDSGGIQEETSFLGVPCLTVRENTERPVTITHGTNLLVGRDVRRVMREVHNILDSRERPQRPIPLWDGKAAERTAALLLNDAGCRVPQDTVGAEPRIKAFVENRA